MRPKDLSSDTQYGLIMFGSIFIGFFLKGMKKRTSRKLIPAVIGFSLVVLFCEKQMFHSLLCLFVVTTLIKLHLKYSAILSFIWSFMYILGMNFCHFHQAFEEPSFITKRLHFLITLKLVGVSFDIKDFRRRQNTRKSLNCSKNYSYASNFDIEPSFFDLFSYTYCFAGIFTGPHYTFKTFTDFVNFPLKSFNETPFHIKNRKKITLLFISSLLFVLFPKFTVYKSLAIESYSNVSFFRKILYPFCIWAKMRLKFYTVWLSAELAFHALNFGVYPEITKPRPGCGPTCNFEKTASSNGSEMSSETIKNINPFKIETAMSVKEQIDGWNMTVKWWLGHYVYKRFPVKFLRPPVTMVTSACLHGIQAGLYMTSLNLLLVSKAEKLLEKHVASSLPKALLPLFKFYSWFMAFRAAEYMTVVGHFTMDEILKMWEFMNWYIHVYCVVIIVVLSCAARSKFSSKLKSY